MNVSVDQLLLIIGRQTVEINLLHAQLAQIQAELVKSDGSEIYTYKDGERVLSGVDCTDTRDIDAVLNP